MSTFLSEGAVEGWLHYPPQDQTNFSLEGLTNLHFLAVMREYNVVLAFFPGSSIFLKVCSTWGICRFLFKLSIHSTVLYTNHFFVFVQTGVLSLISMGTAQNVHEYIESFISATRKEVPISSRCCNI